MNARSLAKELFKQRDSFENLDALVHEFVLYIEKKNMQHLLPGILKQLEILAKKDREENSFKLTFAKEPTVETVENVKSYLKNTEPPEVLIDEKILGGFISEHKGRVVDASSVAYLKSLKQELLS